MIFPLLCFSSDLDTFFCLFTSKKGHSYEKNSDLQFHCILQTTRDSREEKKIFHVVQLKSYFFFVHPLPSIIFKRWDVKKSAIYHVMPLIDAGESDTQKEVRAN